MEITLKGKNLQEYKGLKQGKQNEATEADAAECEAGKLKWQRREGRRRRKKKKRGKIRLKMGRKKVSKGTQEAWMGTREQNILKNDDNRS